MSDTQPLAIKKVMNEARHQCFIYHGSPSQQLPVLAEVLRKRLDQGYRCLYLNNPPMVAGLRSYLSFLGIDVIGEVAKSRLILLSESVLTEDGKFDSDVMLKQLEDTLDQALKDGFKGLFATGDMTWEFGSEKNFAKLMDYEVKLEQLFQKRSEMHGICQYHRDTLPCEVSRVGLLTHKTIFVNQTLARFNPNYVQPTLINDQMAEDPALDVQILKICK